MLLAGMSWLGQCCPEIRTREGRTPSIPAGRTGESGQTLRSGMGWDAPGHRGLVRRTGSTDPHVQVGGGRSSSCVAGPSRKIAGSRVHLPVQAGTGFQSERCEGFWSVGGVPQQRWCQFITFPEGPRGENADVCASGVQTLCHDKIDRLGGRFLDGKSADGDEKFVLHVV